MTRIRLNQEYRNKIANRMRVHLEQEDTQEKQTYDDLKLTLDNLFVKYYIGYRFNLNFIGFNLLNLGTTSGCGVK